MPTLTHAEREAIGNYSVQRYNGWGNGSGYPGKANNPACKYVGHGLEYSCADGVTMNFGKSGFPLVSMQPGMSEGYAYCPDALIYGQRHHAIINSWEARPADIILVHTGSHGAQPGHTETVYKVEGAWVFTVGWDSGPSNVDGYTGQGGVHLHKWYCPKGIGNNNIIAVLDADKCINWDAVTRKTDHRKRIKPAPLQKNTANKVKVLTDRLDNRTKPVISGTGHRKSLRRLVAAITRLLGKH